MLFFDPKDIDIYTHTLIVGSTETGKSTLLANIVSSHFNDETRCPPAIIVVDPHGRLATDIAQAVKDWKNVNIIDPMYVAFALNPLELPEYENQLQRNEAISMRVSEMLEVLQEFFGADPDKAPRLRWIFKGALYFLYSMTDAPTFLDLYYFLVDLMTKKAAEIEEMLRAIDIPEDVTKNTIDAISKLEENAYTAVLNRISNFVIPPGSRTTRTFCTRKTTLSFIDMLKPGTLTLFRLPKMHLDNEFRTLLTNTIIMNIYFAIQKRARDVEAGHGNINKVILMIDEFQNVASVETVKTILSEAAKFGLYLWAAHQNLAQLPSELLEALLGNVGNRIVFRVNNDDATILAKNMYPVDVIKVRNPLVQQPPHWMAITTKEVSFTLPRHGIAPPPAPFFHTADDVKTYMESEMNKKYGGAVEDRTIIYRDYLDKKQETTGRPNFSPIQWFVLLKLYFNRAMSDGSLRVEMFHDYNISGEFVGPAVNYLIDTHYVKSRMYEENLVQKGRDVYGAPIYSPPETTDEKLRARELEYELDERAYKEIFDAPIHGMRAGGRLHQRAMHVILKQSWQQGYFTAFDVGQFREPFPDVLTFKPAQRALETKDKKGIVFDPEKWDYDSATAWEVEIYPSKHPEQVRKNLSKNLERNRKVIFAVTVKEQMSDIQRILGEGNYTIIIIDLHMNEQELQAALNEELNRINAANEIKEKTEAADEKYAEEQAIKNEEQQVNTEQPPENSTEQPVKEEQITQEAGEEPIAYAPKELFPKLYERAENPAPAGNEKPAIKEAPAQAENEKPATKETTAPAENEKPATPVHERPNLVQKRAAKKTEILKVLKENPGYTQQQLALATGTPRQSLLRYLAEMEKDGVIKKFDHRYTVITA
jgi:hypothetical protein